MKDFLRALIASIIFLGASTSMTAVSSTQIMISLRPTVTVPGYGNDYDEKVKEPMFRIIVFRKHLPMRLLKQIIKEDIQYHSVLRR